MLEIDKLLLPSLRARFDAFISTGDRLRFVDDDEKFALSINTQKYRGKTTDKQSY